MNPIDSFTGPYSWLSNFYPVTITVDDIPYPTVENAYQAAKFTERFVKLKISGMNPGQAKRYGRSTIPSPTFFTTEYRLSTMGSLLRQKFSFTNFDLCHKLALTNPAELIEGNDWGDTFWGVYRGQGQNNLGKILMSIRDEVQNGILKL